ncbi:MAG: hypothetical protein HKP03_00475 [Xanthomonadales bacterium]|nr:hypothetical protein [Gammaproteobacteria bacterium]NNK36925.1 hypothetical protein [Xanthomonadales bacterium]
MGAVQTVDRGNLKTIVINERESTRVPFLRGILIRSLLDSGLPFEDALGLATQVRDEFGDTAEVSSDTVRERVIELLEQQGFPDVLEPYRMPVAAPARIQVTSQSGATTAFSRGKHERYLQASGMKAEKAEQTTAVIYDQLLASGISSLNTCELGYLTWLCLLEEVSKKTARRYLIWSAFQRSGRPLLLSI